MGPISSWVVALHTALARADPVTLCWAAVIRSVMDCPDIFPRRAYTLTAVTVCRLPSLTLCRGSVFPGGAVPCNMTRPGRRVTSSYLRLLSSLFLPFFLLSGSSPLFSLYLTLHFEDKMAAPCHVTAVRTAPAVVKVTVPLGARTGMGRGEKLDAGRGRVTSPVLHKTH